MNEYEIVVKTMHHNATNISFSPTMASLFCYYFCHLYDSDRQ
jgi:hypothetical protein